MKTIDLLAIGEPLMEFAEVTRADERLYLPGHGGDVSNTIIAAARQGAKTAIFTALGEDAFGQDFLRLWDREGVDRSSVIVRKEGRTGVYFISYGEEGHVFSYARAGSAASLVTTQELPLQQIAASRILHASGISQAISEMDKVTQQNASLVEEASAAAASLEDQAARLTEAVGTFRLQGMNPARSSVQAAPAAPAAPLRPAVADGDNWETF